MNQLKNILLITGLLFVSSCTKNTIFMKYKGLSENKWHKDSIITLAFNAKDSLSKNAIYIHLRNDKNYEFNNLFLIASVTFPNKTVVTDTLEYEMTDVKGRFLGEGFTDLKENKLEYKANITFPIKGNYQFKIRQAMRKIGEENGINYLNGITDVGIEIEKLEE